MRSCVREKLLYNSVLVFALIRFFPLHLVMKSVLMHAVLLLSDRLMFGHVEECAALYILVLFP